MRLLPEFRVTISPAACFMVALILLWFPLQWSVAWLIAAVFHELCHCFAVAVCAEHVTLLCVGIHGARIETDAMTPRKAVFCVLAGPAGGLLLAFLGRWFPRLSLCAFAQSVYNLLPIYPLDGGRALRLLLCMLFPHRIAERLIPVVEGVLDFIAVCFLLWVSIVWKLGLVPLLLGVVIWLKTKKIKIPCKYIPDRVQ